MNSELDEANVKLTGDALRLLKWLAENQQVNLEEALRRAIATECFIYKHRQQGSTVLTSDPSTKEIKEIFFR